MFYYLIKIKNLILDILFPPICVNCRQTLNKEKYLCKNCYKTIKLNTALFCPFCRARLAENKKICRHSKKDFPFPYFLAAAGNYDDPILRNLIHCLKYQKFEKLAPILGEILLNYLKILNFKFFNLKSAVIIPVPLHFWREKQRGFNQSKLIAEYVAKKLNIQLVDALKRVKNNKPQTKSKNREERNKNVEEIFKVINPDLIRGKNIILVDDVYTSGATINETVKILKQNECKKIIALVIAKA
ncbi:MAG: ComF family protein [Patescibacteria group bacterium]